MGGVDPVTLEVVGNYLVAAVREMGTTLMRTAYSTLIREEMDCSTALFDPAGQLVAQADHVPSHQGTLSLAAKTLLGAHDARARRRRDPQPSVPRRHPPPRHHDLQAGVPRATAWSPSPARSATTSTSAVASAGSISTDARDVFEEGLMIPPLKLYRRGVLFEEIFEMIASNIREPRKTLGDLRAQVAAVTVGERRYLELVARHGRRPARRDRGGVPRPLRALMREDLRAYPDGRYAAEGFMDGDGISDEPVRIAVTVTLDRRRRDRGLHRLEPPGARAVQLRAVVGLRLGLLRRPLHGQPADPPERGLLPADPRGPPGAEHRQAGASRRRSRVGSTPSSGSPTPSSWPSTRRGARRRWAAATLT